MKKIREILAAAEKNNVPAERQEKLQILIDFILQKRKENSPVQLNFICTHNSRRSQFAQVWAKVAAERYNIEIESYSGGIEVTSCNPRTINSLRKFGLEIEQNAGENPKHTVNYFDNRKLFLYSKLFNAKENPSHGFAAVMTCSHADENCPFVPGCDKRISLQYEDPKAWDDSAVEELMYDYRSFQIATEMGYVFSKVNDDE